MRGLRPGREASAARTFRRMPGEPGPRERRVAEAAAELLLVHPLEQLGIGPGERRRGNGSSARSSAAAKRWFQGQTSLQMSQPNDPALQPRGQLRRGSDPCCSIVR